MQLVQKLLWTWQRSVRLYIYIAVAAVEVRQFAPECTGSKDVDGQSKYGKNRPECHGHCQGQDASSCMVYQLGKLVAAPTREFNLLFQHLEGS